MNYDKPIFSVVIPAYNEEKYIAESIKFVQKQQGGFDMEIIVVNNASTDKTKQIAESLGVYVIDEPKKGVGQARKTGTEVARGEFVLHIDADTHLPEDYLIQVKKRFDSNSKLVCLGGQFYFYDANLFWRLMRPVLFRPLYVLVYLASLGKVGPLGNNMIFKKTIYNKTTGFDKNLKYGEDGNLTIKLSEFGKIKLDMKLKCFVSSRRFNLLSKEFWVYVLNSAWVCSFGRPLKNELSQH